jgi:hypothetical protein
VLVVDVASVNPPFLGKHVEQEATEELELGSRHKEVRSRGRQQGEARQVTYTLLANGYTGCWRVEGGRDGGARDRVEGETERGGCCETTGERRLRDLGLHTRRGRRDAGASYFGPVGLWPSCLYVSIRALGCPSIQQTTTVSVHCLQKKITYGYLTIGNYYVWFLTIFGPVASGREINSSNLGFFVSQILEFGNSPNVMAKEKG